MEQTTRYSTLLQNAVDAIDAVFGGGYAREHPELVGTLVQAMVIETNTKMTTEVLQQGFTDITDAMKQGGLVEGR